MLPMEPCWSVGFSTKLGTLTERGSPKKIDNTTLSWRTWPARNTFHCCGRYPSLRVLSTASLEWRDTCESVRSKPQRTTEEDRGMGDRDTTTQHRRIMSRNGRPHSPRCVSRPPSKLLRVFLVETSYIVPSHSAIDSFAPPV